jgi:hypothetical protein
MLTTDVGNLVGLPAHNDLDSMRDLLIYLVDSKCDTGNMR